MTLRDRRSAGTRWSRNTRAGALLLCAAIVLCSVAPLWSTPHLLRGAAACPTISDAGGEHPNAPADDVKSAAHALDAATPASSALADWDDDPAMHTLCVTFLDRCRAGYAQRLDRPPILG